SRRGLTADLTEILGPQIYTLFYGGEKKKKQVWGGGAVFSVVVSVRASCASCQDFRYLPGHRSPGEDLSARHHRRHRRKEPGQARSVAVAANAHRGHDRQFDPTWRGRDRFRRGVRRA